MKHYDTDTDLVVGAGVQRPWPGALYAKPVVIHSHAKTGALRRSYLPEKTLDGFSGHYCGCDGLGSTDSFGMPLQGFGEGSEGVGGLSLKTLAVVGAAAVVRRRRRRDRRARCFSRHQPRVVGAGEGHRPRRGASLVCGEHGF